MQWMAKKKDSVQKCHEYVAHSSRVKGLDWTESGTMAKTWGNEQCSG